MKQQLVVLFLLVGLLAWPAEAAVKSTLEDQTSVEVTVYNQNLGLIKDTRQIQLPTGEGELRFMDVAASIQPVTVHAQSVSDPEAFSVLEQNYEYDLMSHAKLMDKYIGKTIKLIEWKNYQDRKDVVEAKLLSNNSGEIYQIGKEIYLGHPGYKVLPEIPENLIAKPTLTWIYDNQKSAPHTLEVSYLTGNIEWKADYVLVLNENDTMGGLSGWVTVNNQSGATYQDAKLKLIAGTIHRAPNRFAEQQMMNYDLMARAAESKSSFVEKGFFEYHIYDLQRPTTIKDRQTKQISLLNAEGVGIEKEMLVYGSQHYYTSRYRERNPKQSVNVYVLFENAKENQLGMPLPEGIVRLYKKDSDESLQFIGEDRIRHTPKNEEVRLKVGEAFDVVAERKQTDFRELTTLTYESAWELTLRNHKEEAVTVGLIEPMVGTWQIVQSSHPYVKEDAFTVRFDVPVPKDGEVKVTYRVRIGL